MKLPLTDLGAVGIITDHQPHELPPNAFSSGNNVCFRDGILQKIPGHGRVFGAPGCRPSWLLPYRDPDTGSYYWIYPGLNDSGNGVIYTYDGTNHTNRTRRNASAAISAISMANPTHVTIASTTYNDGDQVVITGSDSTPSIDGTHTLTKVSATEFTIDVNVTVAGTTGTAVIDSDYTPSALFPTTGGVSNGLPFINNGVDIPQQWDRTGTTLNTTLTDFANWPAGYTARVMRRFKEFIIALDIDDGTNVRNPYRVMWGDPPGSAFTEPTTWVAAAGNLAGDIYLNESGGYAIDCLPLRNVNVIYAQSATYAMRYVGGNAVFDIDLMFSEHGMLAARCVKPFRDGRHFVVTTGDIIVHDGVTATSVADGRVREAIFSEIDDANYPTAFVTPNYDKEEMWFCYPTTGNSLPNKAAIFNVNSGAWSFRDLTNVSHIAYGVTETGANVWDDDSATWDSDGSVWDSPDYNPTVYSLLMAQQESTAATSLFHKVDHGNLFDGATYEAVVQRVGLDIAGIGPGGYIKAPFVTKDISAAYIEGYGSQFDIRFGGCDTATGTYTWGDWKPFFPEQNYKVDLRQNHRFWGYEIRSTGDVEWRVSRIDVDLKAEDER